MELFLPKGYIDACQYFNDISCFLNEYSWVFNVPVVKILVEEVLEEVPEQWSECIKKLTNEELNNFPFGLIKEDWPESLKLFCKKCYSFQLKYEDFAGEQMTLPNEMSRGLNAKKKHEIVNLAQLINLKCKKTGIKNIVDVGAGLGYLSQLLSYTSDYSVLCLESNPHRLTSAIKRNKKLHFTKDKIKYEKCQVSLESINKVDRIIEERFSSSSSSLDSDMIEQTLCENKSGDEISEKPLSEFNLKNKDLEINSTNTNSYDVCLIGLHTCGDLGADALTLFLNNSSLKLMILVPCCYHKMTTNDSKTCASKETVNELEMQEQSYQENKCSFNKFPLSDTLASEIKHKAQQYSFISKPMLRLAAQGVFWQEMSEQYHKEHSLYVMMRAVLQLFADKRKVHIKKKRRRFVRCSQFSTIENFIQDAISRNDFVPLSSEIVAPNPSEIKQEVENLWNEHSHKMCLVEVLTALQTILTRTIESLILCDRMVYLMEKGLVKHCNIVRSMNERISSRCFTIVAHKSRNVESD